MQLQGIANQLMAQLFWLDAPLALRRTSQRLHQPLCVARRSGPLACHACARPLQRIWNNFIAWRSWFTWLPFAAIHSNLEHNVEVRLPSLNSLLSTTHTHTHKNIFSWTYGYNNLSFFFFFQLLCCNRQSAGLRHRAFGVLSVCLVSVLCYLVWRCWSPHAVLLASPLFLYFFW